MLEKKNKNNTTIIRNTQTARNINVIIDCREKRHEYLLESLQSRMMISDYLTTECKSLMGMKTS
jgi:myo-inositol catabolism protein IolC